MVWLFAFCVFNCNWIKIGEGRGSTKVSRWNYDASCSLFFFFLWHGNPFFWLVGVSGRGSHGGVGWELLGGKFEDYIRFVSCHLFGPVNHGQNWKGWERSGEKAWLSVIIKLKLAWLSRSMILPLGTSPWWSISVIHAKNSLKGLILIIPSTYQAW